MSKARKAVICQIVNSAMIELVLDTYSEIKILDKVYDQTLKLKLHNIKPALERQAKKNYDFFAKTAEREILNTYFRTQNAFEVISEVAKSGDVDRFGQLIDLLEAFQNNELTVIEKEDVKEERLSQLQESKGDV
jgi:hypothetical protein